MKYLDTGMEAKIHLAGSEDYWDAWDRGSELEKSFPGQDAGNLTSACTYNSWGPLGCEGVSALMLVEQGQHEGPDWVWLVRLMNGEHWFAQGGCDYTGWDCQSYLIWAEFKV